MKKFISLALVITLMLTSLVVLSSCGKTAPADDTAVETTKHETTVVTEELDVTDKPDNPNVDPADEAEDTVQITVEEDDNTVVLNISGQIHEYKHDGTNITSYKVYMDLGTVEEAKDAYNMQKALLDSQGEDGPHKSVDRQGQYVIIEYNESMWDYHTYEEVKAASDALSLLAGLEG